jgi:hypothetical protein
MSNGAVVAILLTVIVHFAGMVLLFLAMGDDFRGIFRTSRRPRGDDGPPPPDEPLAPEPPGGGQLPLPDAEQAALRLREPGRIGEQYPRPARRPEHAPERVPAHRPVRQ